MKFRQREGNLLSLKFSFLDALYFSSLTLLAIVDLREARSLGSVDEEFANRIVRADKNVCTSRECTVIMKLLAGGNETLRAARPNGVRVQQIGLIGRQ
jgi:hypothetical protein